MCPERVGATVIRESKKEKGKMKKNTLSALSLIFAVMLLTGVTVIFRAYAPSTWQGYVKPSFPDYAQSGMPDFDEKQDNWKLHGFFTWCGPVAAADVLWWLDSEYESLVDPNPVVPPPTISDHFPLIPAFGPWDDHDPQNVAPLVPALAIMMDTDGIHSGDGHIGTRFADLVNGIQTYVAAQGLSRIFEVHNTQFPTFTWIDTETEKCQGVILFLEFYQLSGGTWLPFTSDPSLEAGHFVACAGANATLNPNQVLISDPYKDNFEMGTDPLGREPVAPPAHNPAVHNDTQYVSQDGYTVTQWLGPPPSPYGGVPVWELVNYLQISGYPDPSLHTFIRGAVATSPIPVSEWPGYIKPAYPDYAPSGMPDFDEKQPGWNPTGAFTWCVPVAVADSLWWLDSKYESIFDPAPVAPPTISDHFSLVTSYNSSYWDDHGPSNVDPLVRNLTWFMDTDGLRSHDGHIGTRWTDIQSGIQGYLKQQGVATMFEVHNASYADFPWIDNETEKCQDVELCLEFWQLGPGGWENYTSDPNLNQGHCVTCAGSNSTASQVLISDPYLDAYEAGSTPGRSPVPEAYPHNAAAHNDTRYVSQDAYNVTTYTFPPVPPPPAGYPLTVWELQGYAQVAGLAPGWHAFIRGAIATSPLEVHDIAVTNVTSPKKVIFQGYTGNVTTTVTNLGNLPENVNVTLYANMTAFMNGTATSKETKIGNFTNVPIITGTNVNLTIVWNTTGLAKGNYTLVACADALPGETNTANNNFTDGWVMVTRVGDLNYDDRCEGLDIVIVARAFGSYGPDYFYPGSPATARWNPNADVNNDNQNDGLDIVIVARHYGEGA